MIDHLVYGSADLPATLENLQQQFGLPLTEGGRHVGRGTRNYLADLGQRRYLELIGPDTDQGTPDGGRMFDVDTLTIPRLLTWAVAVDDLPAVRASAKAAGYDMAPLREMERFTPEGDTLTWTMSAPLEDRRHGGLTPFLIQWGSSSPHPSQQSVHGLMLESLTLSTPEPDALAARLEVLGITGALITPADSPGLSAVISTADGHRITL